MQKQRPIRVFLRPGTNEVRESVREQGGKEEGHQARIEARDQEVFKDFEGAAAEKFFEVFATMREYERKSREGRGEEIMAESSKQRGDEETGEEKERNGGLSNGWHMRVLDWRMREGAAGGTVAREELFDEGPKLAETVGEEMGLRIMREEERAENQMMKHEGGAQKGLEGKGLYFQLVPFKKGTEKTKRGSSGPGWEG